MKQVIRGDVNWTTGGNAARNRRGKLKVDLKRYSICATLKTQLKYANGGGIFDLELHYAQSSNKVHTFFAKSLKLIIENCLDLLAYLRVFHQSLIGLPR